MPTPPVTDEAVAATLAGYLANDKQQTRTALALGLSRETVQRHLRIASERGLTLDHPPAMPGFRISQVTTAPSGKQSIQQRPEHGEKFEAPKGMRAKGVTALVNSDGRLMHQHLMFREGAGPSAADIAETLKVAFADYAPAASPTPAPVAPASSMLTLLPANDWHIGLSTWGKQVGNNWDLKIAEKTIGNSAEDAVERSPSSGHCIVLGGGDLLHVNGKRNETANGTPQDVDSRYQKSVDTVTRLMVRTIDAARRRHDQVTVRVLKGNHDEDSCVAIAYFLLAWYRNEPRVTVDVDPSDYFWFRFGKVLLGATHGHQSTNHIAKMPGIMAHRRAEDWGATKFRYVHGFHLHHSAKIATEGNGVICEIHQAPIPQDAWHFGSGFLSGRSLQAITYHREFGEIGRVRTAILDASPETVA